MHRTDGLNQRPVVASCLQILLCKKLICNFIKQETAKLLGFQSLLPAGDSHSKQPRLAALKYSFFVEFDKFSMLPFISVSLMHFQPNFGQTLNRFRRVHLYVFIEEVNIVEEIIFSFYITLLLVASSQLS